MRLGPVMLDLEGTTLCPVERELLCHPAVGGVILFRRNFEDPAQVKALVAEIRALRDPHLLVAVDQEGGRVQRFQNGFTRLPPAAWYGALYHQDRERGRRVAGLAGWIMAAELRAVGVDFSFAPVLDLGVAPSTVIGDRAFAPRAEAVADLGRAWIKGCQSAGMAAVGKHFPGHGNVMADSHTELPIDHRRFQDILMADLVPFERLIRSGMEAIMPAHLVYPQVDSRPAGFSPFWLKRVLRQQLEFQGLIFSDDLNMAAADAGGDYPSRAHAALEAGCDLVLICNNRPAAEAILTALRGHEDPAAHLRYVRMHGRGGEPLGRLRLDARWHQAVRALAELQPPESLDLNLT